jgi:hypothetical protein
MNSRFAMTIVAIFAGPVMAGILMALIFGMMFSGVNLETRRIASQIAFFGTIAFGIPSTLIIGLPVHALLLAMRWTRWWSYAIAGGACGILFAAALYYWGWGLLEEVGWGFRRSEWREPSIVRAYATLAGHLILASPITAICCWLIRRPDRDRASMAQLISQEPPVDAHQGPR